MAVFLVVPAAMLVALVFLIGIPFVPVVVAALVAAVVVRGVRHHRATHAGVR